MSRVVLEDKWKRARQEEMEIQIKSRYSVEIREKQRNRNIFRVQMVAIS